MGEPAPSIIDTRFAQMFPTLATEEVERLRRFGEVRCFAPGEALARVGEIGRGLSIILAGNVDITRKSDRGPRELIVNHAPGGFMGELAQLSGRPSLVDAHAQEEVEALVIAPDQLRALLVAEAEVGERIMRALILRRVGLLETGAGGPIIVGRAGDGNVLRLVNFLTRNVHPHLQLDPDTDACARALVERFEVDADELPIVLCPNGELLRNPGENELARCIGLVAPIDPDRLYDVAIVGAGPAGLAASVYGASEGLTVLALDCRSFGGQAGASARIENFLGFPTGISGGALMGRAYTQAQKFGAEMAIPDEAWELRPGDRESGHELLLANGEKARAKAVVIATGARYRRPDVEGLDEVEGDCVHYWASAIEGRLCTGQDVALVGGGNSAGQAAVFLAGYVDRLTLIARRPLEATMSSYLVDRIAGIPNIDLVTGVEISGLEGDGGKLRALRYRRRDSAEEARREVSHLFLFIGADPNTDWLASAGIVLDDHGFIRAGADAAPGRLSLETSRRGIFAIGDVRSGSVKRVAAAAGDGAQVIASVHAYLAKTPPLAAPCPLETLEAAQ